MRAVAAPLACALALLIAADGVAAEPAPGESLAVRIALIGPGDELYFRWGHFALIIDDLDAGTSRLFDYGLFSFQQADFFYNFAMGRLWFSIGVSDTWRSVLGWAQTNRDVIVYTLDIPPAAREAIRLRAEWDVLPENSDYLYHHFDMNCVTPILYMIDEATGGQFRGRLAYEPGRFTLRQHVRRHLWRSPFFDWLLNFLMGQGIDRPITVWEEMFLPSEAARNIAAFEWTDERGATRRLASGREEVFLSQGRAPVLDYPPARWPRQFALGLAVAAALAALFLVRGRRPTLARKALGACHCALGLFLGLTGSLLFFLTFFTDHDYTFDNANILFANPLLLALVPLGIRLASARAERGRKGKRSRGGAAREGAETRRVETALAALWALSALGVVVSMLIKLTPWFWQDNLADQLMVLPIALAMAAGSLLTGGILKREKARGGKGRAKDGKKA